MFSLCLSFWDNLLNICPWFDGYICCSFIFTLLEHIIYMNKQVADVSISQLTGNSFTLLSSIIHRNTKFVIIGSRRSRIDYRHSLVPSSLVLIYIHMHISNSNKQNQLSKITVRHNHYEHVHCILRQNHFLTLFLCVQPPCVR